MPHYRLISTTVALESLVILHNNMRISSVIIYFGMVRSALVLVRP